MLSPNDLLSEKVKHQVLEKLGLKIPPPKTLDGLNDLYQAWCYHVPFDNVRKLMALMHGQILPGRSAEAFFSEWLNHGVGGTCWPGSNALFTLIVSCGFKARRVTGSMLDLGKPNHASIKVKLEHQDWLADSSILTNSVLPLTHEGRYIHADSATSVDVEFAGDTHIVWLETSMSPKPIPCRLLDDSVDFEFYMAAYDSSVHFGPFNHRLFARKNHPGEVRQLIGRKRFVKSIEGSVEQELTETELMHALQTDIGISENLVLQWAESGALAASMQDAPEG